MPLAFPQRPLAVALCMLPLAAAAQTAAAPAPASPAPVPALQDIVVTASRSPEPLSDVVGDVTVIGPQQLQAGQGESLAQIIGQAPGVQFTTNGGPQTTTGLSLRGADSTQTLVLIDGMRINGATTGGAQFPTLDPALIDHVEILRGAASSLYGSDAIGGVINIITKGAENKQPFSAWANVGAGSYDTAKASAGFSGTSQGWDYSLSAGTATSRGYDVFRPRFANGDPTTTWGHDPDRDGYRSQSLAGTLGYRWAEGHRLGLSFYNSALDGDTDTSTTAPNDTVRYRQQAYALTSSDRIADWWHSELRLGLTQDRSDSRTGPEEDTFGTLRRQYSWINTFTLHPGHQLSLLLERVEERAQSTTAYTQDKRDTNAAALIYKGKMGPLHTQASVRNDHYTGYGNQTTGSLGADVDLGSHWQVGAAGSTAFRAPTFNDLYYPGFFGLYPGNPDLKPEKSKNIEAHVAYEREDGQLRLTVFQNKVSDLIATSSVFPYAPANIDRATLRGMTLAGSYRWRGTTFRGSLDLLDPRNDDPAPGVDSQLPLRARQVVHLSAERKIQAVKVGAEYQYTGSRVDASTQARLGGYSLVNLTASYDFTKSLGVQVRWNNVFDKDYVLVDGYNTPGSNVFVNLSWKM